MGNDMGTTQQAWNESGEDQPVRKSVGWKELYLKEDWWAIWLGLGIIAVAYFFFIQGSSIKWIAITPKKWADFDGLAKNFTGEKITQYAALFGMWLVIFSVSARVLGFKLSEFIPSFIFVFAFSILIFAIGSWDKAAYYQLEAPLVALLLGLAISNFVGLPKWMDAGFRVE